MLFVKFFYKNYVAPIFVALKFFSPQFLSFSIIIIANDGQFWLTQ